MPSAIPYIRFSSARQTSGSSAERQRQMVTRWVQDHPDYTLSDLTYEDLGRSGYHGEHVKEGGGFAKLLQAVEAGLIKGGDCVLVEAIDRTGRLPAFEMIAEVLKPILYAGVNIVTLDDQIEYTKESVNNGHLHLLAAKIQAAHSYSKALSERTKASYAIRREQAKATGKVKRHTPIWLTSGGDVIEHIAVHVRQAFELYASGVGKTTIANRLRTSGVSELSKCSGPTVEGWLRNKAVIGYWDEIPNVYPSIISDELFLLAQQRKKAVATMPRQRTSKNHLVGLVVCGVCGSNYIVHQKDGKPNNMRCGTHHRLKSAGCANSETIPYQVVSYVYSLTAVHWIERALQAIQLSANDKRKLALTSERDVASSAISRLTKLLATVDDDEITTELQSYSERRKAIDVELSVLERSPIADGNTLNAAITQDRMMIADPVQLNGLLKQAGYRISVYQGKLIKVVDEIFPWVYQGIKRKSESNVTLGYRMLHLGEEMIISPELPELINWGEYTDNPIEGIRYMLRRSHKLISVNG
ncbi:recombinase family protein [Pseudomonas putida]|uniref:Recombinase family protein n=1 Tax=Pseudomonas putida TaxID=303 RepID=A0A6I6Y3N8_PSEPU|nr:recombinase family protein [Pseudomonas putida]QHG66229.1 recombinase family protein [Pseudomonas putida]